MSKNPKKEPIQAAKLVLDAIIKKSETVTEKPKTKAKKINKKLTTK